MNINPPVFAKRDCRKKRYTHGRAAIEHRNECAKKRERGRSDRKEQTVHLCRRCWGWHVTSLTREEYAKIRQETQEKIIAWREELHSVLSDVEIHQSTTVSAVNKILQGSMK